MIFFILYLFEQYFYDFRVNDKIDFGIELDIFGVDEYEKALEYF